MAEAVAVAAVLRLVSLEAHLRDGQQLEPSVAAAIADSITAYRTGEECAEAFGVKPLDGEPDPRSQLRRAQRDALIKSTAAKFFASLGSEAAQAAELRRRLLRYFASGWRHDNRDVMPAKLARTLHGAFWQILRVIPVVPSERTIRRALAKSSPSFWPADWPMLLSSPMRTTRE